MGNRIVCGRFDNVISFSVDDKEHAASNVRITADNPNKLRRNSYIPIATNGAKVHHDGKILTGEEFFDIAASINGAKFIVLTTREYFSLLEHKSFRNISIEAFEACFPIFPDIRYSSDLERNLGTLKRLLKNVHRLEIKSGTFARDQTSRHFYSISRKLRFKNKLDHHFFFSYKDGYQEVFKLTEERENRTIIAFDFNSMFADCMRGDFCEPRSIRYQKFSASPADLNNLDEGIYRTTLVEAKESFLLDFHPFLYKRLGTSHYFKLQAGDTIETVLHKNEVIYYQKYFEKVEIHEGFSSSRSIHHPLNSKAEKLYRDRNNYRASRDRLMQNYCKISMQLMHSSSNKRLITSQYFESLGAALQFLGSEFHLNLSHGVTPDELNDLLKKSKYFKIEKHKHRVKLFYPDIKSPGVIYSLSSKIIANARLKTLGTIERFLKHRSVEICYSNIDSIHISVESNEVEAFLEAHKDLISNEMGCLKIEAVADQGYWFDVGRYWLKKKGEVILFKNKSFNQEWKNNEFISARKAYSITASDAFDRVSSHFLALYNSFSYAKRLDLDYNEKSMPFVRYLYEEVETSGSANLTHATEILKSKTVRKELFQRIRGDSRD